MSSIFASDKKGTTQKFLSGIFSNPFSSSKKSTSGIGVTSYSDNQKSGPVARTYINPPKPDQYDISPSAHNNSNGRIRPTRKIDVASAICTDPRKNLQPPSVLSMVKDPEYRAEGIGGAQSSRRSNSNSIIGSGGSTTKVLADPQIAGTDLNQSGRGSSEPKPNSIVPVVCTSVMTAPKALVCDKCDGKHETDNCPYFKKPRDNHPDAQKNSKKLGGFSNLPGNYRFILLVILISIDTMNVFYFFVSIFVLYCAGATLRTARVVRQPGDGSCLFHSLSYGLKDGSNASSLRREVRVLWSYHFF